MLSISVVPVALITGCGIGTELAAGQGGGAAGGLADVIVSVARGPLVLSNPAVLDLRCTLIIPSVCLPASERSPALSRS